MPNSYTNPPFLHFIAPLNLCGNLQTSTAFLEILQGTRGTEISSKWICVFRNALRFFQLFRYLIQINLLKGSGGPWIMASLPHFAAPPLYSPARKNCQIIREEKVYWARIWEGPRKVRRRYHQIYIIFASLPIWFKALSRIYWWALHYKKWFIPYCLIFIMIQSKVNCAHAVCSEQVQWGGISWLLKNTFILLSIVFNGLLQWKKNHLNAKILHLFMWWESPNRND